MSINDRVFQAVLDRGLRPEDFAKELKKTRIVPGSLA